MIPTRRISANHYYEYLPEVAHACGDIWRGLPSQGLVGTAPISGLVVTPACDLSNSKVETIVYLPVIPIRMYFSLPAALPEIREKIRGCLNGAKFDPNVDWGPLRYRPPKLPELERVLAEVKAEQAKPNCGTKERTLLRRAESGLLILRFLVQGSVVEVPSELLASVFGSEWLDMKKRIIGNGYRVDMHFIPKDDQATGFEALRAHSLVLFRYPLTAPIQVLDLAYETSEEDWKAVIDEESITCPAALSFKAERPLKVLSLKSEFRADLLSRYCAVYGRLGSPDFSAPSIAKITDEVDAP